MLALGAGGLVLGLRALTRRRDADPPAVPDSEIAEKLDAELRSRGL
jgi:hypothetical protein